MASHPQDDMMDEYSYDSYEDYPNYPQSSMDSNEGSGHHVNLIYPPPPPNGPPSQTITRRWRSPQNAQQSFGYIGSIPFTLEPAQMSPSAVGLKQATAYPTYPAPFPSGMAQPPNTSAQPDPGFHGSRHNSTSTAATGSIDEDNFCANCNKSFTRSIDLKRHNKTKEHANQFSILCGQQFNYKKPCSCPVCGRRFTRPDNVKRHQRQKNHYPRR